jgi:hypothetical protein
MENCINLEIFGSKFHIEYAYNHSFINKNVGQRIIAVRKIPENVSENDLCRLFFNGSLIKYFPSKIVHSKNPLNNNKKILSG